MRLQRLAAALLVALIVSGCCTYLLGRRVMKRVSSRPQTVAYVAVQRPAAPGEILKPDNLVLVEWPTSVPVQGAFAKVDDVAGRASIYALAPGQPIVDRLLAVPGSGIGVTAKIPEGMRATALRSNEVAGVAGFLFPGSRVDVLVTYHSEPSNMPRTQIALQDAEVLTAGQRIEPDPQGKPEAVSVVTLLLTPEDAQRIVLASTQGTVQFVLRNSADRGKVTAQPVGMAEISGERAAVPAVPQARSGRKPYIVETFNGEKRQTSSFN